VSMRGTYLKMSSEKKAEIASTSKVGIPSRLRVLTAAARSINESSSARMHEIEFQHVTSINNVGVACLGQ